MIQTESLPEATTSAAPARATVRQLAMAGIHDRGDNVRRELGDLELAAGIGVHGVIQAVVVRPSPSGGYELTAGVRVADPLEQGDRGSQRLDTAEGDAAGLGAASVEEGAG